jgi:hypothetical protein
MPRKSATKRRQYDPGALAEAARRRGQHRTVRLYLEALDYRQSVRTRRTDPERLEARRDAIDEELASAHGLERVKLIQERMDLEDRLQYEASDDDDVVFEGLQEDFVAVAAEWATRKGLSYSSLRQIGVPAAVLQRAGIARTRSR